MTSSVNINRTIKSRRMRWATHVASIGEIRNAQKTLAESLRVRDHSEDLDVDGRLILKYI
jgi:hypothetical protein